MKITFNLNFRLILLFCMITVCKIAGLQATELSDFSPIVGLGQENFTFEISEFDPTNKAKIVKFEPNIAGIVRLGINAYGFGVGYSFRANQKDTDLRKGTTHFSDWQLSYHNTNWSAEFVYQDYTGFYTSNTNDIQFHQNLNFNQLAINGRYSLEDNSFSVTSLIDQAEDIKETMGKYFLVGGVRQHSMKTDSSLLQQEHAGINLDLEKLRELRSQSINVGLGVGKTWLYGNNLFTGAEFDLLSTFANYSFISTDSNTSSSDLTLSYNLKFAFGYRGSRYKSGISLAGDITTLKTTGKGFLKPSANRFLMYLRIVF